jgi:3-dehydroquinate synthetase
VVAQEKDSRLAAATNRDLGYPIVIGEDLGAIVGDYVRERGARTALLYDAEPAVARIAARIAERILPRPVATLGFRLGERRKRLSMVERVLEKLSAAGVERDVLLVGVGGGVASDLFGFAAATYMRGVPYAHVATSLVAMADAAIGGKTGVDLVHGKNLVGIFSDPVAVFCDVSALYTLPLRAVRDGLAEVVKAAIICGGEFFQALEVLSAHRFVQWPWAEVVSAAVKVKTEIVSQDRADNGKRQLLNLGHTFAHALERASGYRITHGAAVALGLRASGLLALRTGRLGEREYFRVLTLLTLLGMPLRTSLRPAEIFEAMRADKKRRDGRLQFVLPRGIGDVEYGISCSDALVRAVLARLGRMPSAAG